MRGCIVLFIALLFSFDMQAGEEILGSRFNHGVWYGAGYSSSQSGNFMHCAISALFKSGDELYMSVNADGTISIGVSNPKFEFETGSTFPVTLSVDRRTNFHGRAITHADGLMVINLDQFPEVFTALKRGMMLRMDSDLVKGAYSLRGTSRALDATLECAMKHKAYRNAAVGAATRYDRSMLYQIAMEMIAEVGIRDFEILSESEIEEIGVENAVIWQSDPPNLIGSVFLVSTQEGQTIRDNDSLDIEELTRQCEGDVISGVRALESAERPMREIRVICSLEGQSRETISSKMMLDGAILYTTLIFIDHEPERAMNDRDRQDLSEGIRLRAASFVKENNR